MDDFFAVNAGFPNPNCTRTDGLDPHIVPGPAPWTYNNRAEPVRDLQVPRQLSHGGCRMSSTRVRRVWTFTRWRSPRRCDCVRRRAAIPRLLWRAECAISWRGHGVTAAAVSAVSRAALSYDRHDFDDARDFAERLLSRRLADSNER